MFLDWVSSCMARNQRVSDSLLDSNIVPLIRLINPAALELVAAHAMAPVFETARMYTGTAPTLAIDRLDGITTFELG